MKATQWYRNQVYSIFQTQVIVK